jgi:hypothetical protein
MRTRLDKLIRERVPIDAWCLNVDLDEFVEVDRFVESSGALRALVLLSEAYGYSYITGHLIDMVAEGGTLNKIRTHPALSVQFPIACNVSRRILRAACNKVVLCKAHHRCSGGAHRVLDRLKHRFPLVLRVNHFKWDRTVIPRLEVRYNSYLRAGYRHAKESRRFLEHVQRLGRVDLRQVDFVGRLNSFGSGSLSRGLFKFIVRHVPWGSTVLELGSGPATAELSLFFRMHSIEHSSAWLNRYNSCYIHAPLTNAWYDVHALKRGISDLTPAAIIVDGPLTDEGYRGFCEHLQLFDVSGFIFFDDIQLAGQKHQFAALIARLAKRRHKIIESQRVQSGIIFPAAGRNE